MSLFDNICHRMTHPVKVEAAGIEPPPQNTGETGASHESGAESGAVGAQNDPIDADLLAIIEAWPALPDAIKAALLALVHDVKGK